MIKYIDEIILGLFGVIILIFNLTNNGSLEITVIGALMIAAAILEVIVSLLEKKKAKKE